VEAHNSSDFSETTDNYEAWKWPDVPETADEGGIQMAYSSDYLCSPNIGVVKKKYL
jgi:hypothetical protein